MRAAATTCVASPKMKTRLFVRYVESTEREYQPRLQALPESAAGTSTPASAATYAMKSSVAPTPIGTVFVQGC